MNSIRPSQGPKDGPQSLPQDDDLAAKPPIDVETPDEKMERIDREGQINRVTPQPETHTGADTTGAGQPTLQPVNQGQSLPQGAIPVEKRFEGTDQFYDPMAAERAAQKKERSNGGGNKADF